MIPLILRIKNFLSYGSELQTIDFTPHHLICLSGKNGHGKSALLDAITWALWGVARKTTTSVKPDQGLLRIGQSHMMVIFDFALGNETYRVRREFVLRYGKPQSTLDFGIINSAHTFVPLTEKTTRDTQRIIEEILNLDCETFIHSAFIKQGQSHAFSKKTAAERKEIFATILGLNQYDAIRKRAMEKIKDAQQKERTLYALQEKIRQELNNKKDLEDALTNHEKIFTHIISEEKKLYNEIIALEKEELCILQKKDEDTYLYNQEKALVAQQEALTHRIHTIRDEWRSYHYQKITMPDRKTIASQYEALHTQIIQHRKKLEESVTLKEDIITKKETLQKLLSEVEKQNHTTILQLQIEQEKLIAESRILEHKKNESETSLSEFDAIIKHNKQCMIEGEKKKKVYADKTRLCAEYELLFEKKKAFYQKYTAQGKILHEQIKELTQKQSAVNAIENACCPLCEQTLSASRCRFLYQKYGQEITFMHHRYQRIVRVITELKPTLIDDHTTLQKHKTELELLAHDLHLHANLEKQTLIYEIQHKEAHTIHETIILKYKEIIAQIQEHTLHLERHKGTIIEKQKDPQIQTLLEQISHNETLLKNICYNKNSHHNDEQAIARLYTLINNQQEMHANEAMQKDRKDLIRSIKNESRVLETTKKELSEKRAICQQKIALLAPIQSKKQEYNNRATFQKEEKERLIEEKGRLIQKYETLKSLEKDLEQYTKEHQTITRHIADYTSIAHAMGKDGIQAYLIEEAIPEIEHEANRILARLSNTNAQIHFESLRDLKSGGTKETLDLTISDTSGTRPYDLFSGGEAFRIDFALRIALSKLLAHRAGTALQTLIIDEGFGSQDDEGLSAIMEALHAIRDDFQKIIVVSHLESMKDQFPVHFIIQKNASGSSVHIMHQG